MAETSGADRPGTVTSGRDEKSAAMIVALGLAEWRACRRRCSTREMEISRRGGSEGKV